MNSETQTDAAAEPKTKAQLENEKHHAFRESRDVIHRDLVALSVSLDQVRGYLANDNAAGVKEHWDKSHEHLGKIAKSLDEHFANLSALNPPA